MGRVLALAAVEFEVAQVDNGEGLPVLFTGVAADGFGDYGVVLLSGLAGHAC